MKRKIMLLALAVLLSLCLNGAGCNRYYGKQPYNYKGVWVCDEPQTTYYTFHDDAKRDYAEAVIDGKTVRFELGFLSATVDAWRLLMDAETGEPVTFEIPEDPDVPKGQVATEDPYHTDEILFSGICEYAPTAFTITLSEDHLFDGEYDALSFYRLEE